MVQANTIVNLNETRRKVYTQKTKWLLWKFYQNSVESTPEGFKKDFKNLTLPRVFLLWDIIYEKAFWKLKHFAFTLEKKVVFFSTAVMFSGWDYWQYCSSILWDKSSIKRQHNKSALKIVFFSDCFKLFLISIWSHMIWWLVSWRGYLNSCCFYTQHTQVKSYSRHYCYS